MFFKLAICVSYSLLIQNDWYLLIPFVGGGSGQTRPGFCELDFKYDYRCSLSTCQSGNRRSKFPNFWRNHSCFRHLCDVMCSRNQKKNNKVSFYIDVRSVADYVGLEHPKNLIWFSIANITVANSNTWARIWITFKRNPKIFHWCCWNRQYRRWLCGLELRKRKNDGFTFFLSELVIQWMIFIANKINLITDKPFLSFFLNLYVRQMAKGQTQDHVHSKSYLFRKIKQFQII